MAIEDYYVHSVAITRQDGTLTEGGMLDKSSGNWSALETVTGLIRPTSGREVFTAGKEVAVSSHVLDTAAGASMQPKDRATEGANVYDILAVRNPRDMDHHLIVDLELRA